MKQGTVAIATLLYSPDYLPGVFTLITQLNRLLPGKSNLSQVKTVLFVTPEIYNDALTDLSRDILQRSFHQIIQIDPLVNQSYTEEQNRQNLQLLQRPELAFALIKARLWEHTEFNQILYLDADTLPLNDTLFHVFDLTEQQTKYQIGAAADIGWPDMFNSGVMTIVPDRKLAQDLHDFILRETSIDGADQGILNQFFNPKCGITKENDWILLPFLYNVTTPNNGYQCPPAMLYFKDQIKLIHFIGKSKPWKAWTVKDFISNEYTNLWHEIYNGFAQDNNISHDFTPIETQESISYSQEHEEHHEEYQEEYHEPAAVYQEEEHHEEYHREEQQQHSNDHHNLEPYVHQEAIKEMEEKVIEQEQHLNEPIAKPPTPVQLPLDFKEWLTTFIDKDNAPKPESHIDEFHLDSHADDHQEQHHNEEPYHEPTPEYPPEPHYNEPTNEHFEPESHEGDKSVRADEITEAGTPIETKPISEPEPEPIEEPEPTPNYKFAWEETNYLQKVERIFPGDIFAYETKVEDAVEEPVGETIQGSADPAEEEEQTGEERNSDEESESQPTLSNPNLSTAQRAKVGSDRTEDNSENRNNKLGKEKDEKPDSPVTTKIPQKKKTGHTRKKSVRQRLEELTAKIDFGLKDYIDIGGSDGEDDNTKA